MIDNGATSRKYFNGNESQTVTNAGYLPVSDELDCAFADYVQIDPATPTLGVRNPASAQVTGLFKPLSAADGRLYFKIEGFTTLGGWQSIDVMAIRYYYASDVNKLIEFNILWADDGIGQPASAYESFRVVCKQLDAAGGDVSLSFVNTRMEQVNFYA
jgi:hypothetical protein